MLERSFFHTNSRTETFAPLTSGVIDDALLDTMPECQTSIKRCFS